MEKVFACQTRSAGANVGLASATTDTILLAAKATVDDKLVDATQDLNDVNIYPIDLVKHFQLLDEATICISNSHYAKYGTVYTVENLAWTKEKLLDSCEEPLRDKLREGLVSVLATEKGGPLIFKHMLDLMMDLDTAALMSLTQSLQTLRMKDIPGEDVSTAARYLKGALLLLQNCCTVLPTDTLGLLNDIMCSEENDEFTGCMKLIYYNHKRKPAKNVNFMKYLRAAESESEYRTLYRCGKWDKAGNGKTKESESGFYFLPQEDLKNANNNNAGERDGRYTGGGRGRGHGQGRGRGRGEHHRWANIACHVYRLTCHLARNCRAPG